MIKLFCSVLLFTAVLLSQSIPKQGPWSVRLAESFIAQHPDSIVYAEEEKSRRWNYEQGLMLESFYQMYVHTGDRRYIEYLKKNLDNYIRQDGSINTYKLTEFNIDNITPGVPVLRAFDLFKDAKYRTAADTLRRQLALHPRTSEGGFWHKKIYPHQMWLDGLYMGETFYALYSRTFNDGAAFNDIANQFLLIEKHLKDPKTGLYYHGWDESKQMGWANKETGCSPNFWGRSMGWYAMALVDVLDNFPAQHPKRKQLEKLFKEYMEAVLRIREPKTMLWYQVLDRAGSAGNYPEASASSMFVYAMAKGVNKGYLPKEFRAAATESYNAVLKQLVTVDEQGFVSLHDVVRVSGLGGNPYRDGSYEYYISEQKRTNDFKGYGPLMLAAIEMEKLSR
ncbi:MAG: glycoside hydrolase family 88/105 protein [Bacteroidota bacterium]